MKNSLQKRSSIYIGGTIFIFIVYIFKLYFAVTENKIGSILFKILDSDGLDDLIFNIIEHISPFVLNFISGHYEKMTAVNGVLGLILLIKLHLISDKYEIEKHKIEYVLWSCAAIFFACETFSDIWLSTMFSATFGIFSIAVDCMEKVVKRYKKETSKPKTTKVKVKVKKKSKKQTKTVTVIKVKIEMKNEKHEKCFMEEKRIAIPKHGLQLGYKRRPHKKDRRQKRRSVLLYKKHEFNQRLNPC